MERAIANVRVGNGPHQHAFGQDKKQNHHDTQGYFMSTIIISSFFDTQSAQIRMVFVVMVVFDLVFAHQYDCKTLMPSRQARGN